MTAQTTITEHSDELAVAAAGHAREAVIALREAAMAKIGELVAFEDDLTVHRIARQILAVRPQATGLEVVVDDDGYGFLRVSGMVGLDEDALYQELVDAADNELFIHSSIVHRAQRADGAAITGHGYTATWVPDERALTGNIDLAAAATTPQPPALLTSPALADFIA